MPFDHNTAQHQSERTSCGCCTIAWGLKVLEESNNVTAGPLQLPVVGGVANRDFNFDNDIMEQSLFPMREGNGYTMPSKMLEFLLMNTNNCTAGVEVLPGIETIFNNIGYANAVVALNQVLANYPRSSKRYVDSQCRNAGIHRFSIGLMARTNGELHWLFQEGGNGCWVDPGDPQNNRHWFKAHTAYHSGGFPVGLNIYFYS